MLVSEDHKSRDTGQTVKAGPSSRCFAWADGRERGRPVRFWRRVTSPFDRLAALHIPTLTLTPISPRRLVSSPVFSLVQQRRRRHWSAPVVEKNSELAMRDDVQCLRGIAISAVFLFHLLPSAFPNGFLGVDVFFVISGFLMAMVLSKNAPLQPSWVSLSNASHDLIMFYYRRVKRIWPTYYLFIAGTLLAVHWWQTEPWWPTNQRYSLSALFFATNQLIIHDSGDYFLEFMLDGSSMNMFIHCWSLGVEVQFYLLVPFIFAPLAFLKTNTFKLTAVGVICVADFVLFASINQQFAFNFMFARLWQFAAGFVAFFASQLPTLELPPKQEKTKLVIDGTCVALAVLFCCFLPFQLPAAFARPLITAVTAVLIVIESKNNKMLRSASLGYIGDLSYIIYLIHWPIITLIRTSSWQSKYFCVALTLLVAILLHHLFEKPTLKLRPPAVFALLTLLIGINACLQYTSRSGHMWHKQYPADVAATAAMNKAFLQKRWLTNDCEEMCKVIEFKHDFVPSYGHCVFAPGNGTLKVLLMGNSYTLNQAELIRQQFDGNYSSFQYLALDRNQAMFAFADPISEKALVANRRVVAELKPDILFLITRFSDVQKAPFYGDPSEDDVVKEYNKNIAYYERYTKKVMVMGSHPYYPINFLNVFVDYLLLGRDTETLHLSRVAADNEMSFARRRISSIRCNNCTVYELSKEFVDGEKYLSFDRDTQLSFIDNDIHLTDHALRRLAPFYRRLVRQLLDEVR